MKITILKKIVNKIAYYEETIKSSENYLKLSFRSVPPSKEMYDLYKLKGTWDHDYYMFNEVENAIEYINDYKWYKRKRRRHQRSLKRKYTKLKKYIVQSHSFNHTL